MKRVALILMAIAALAFAASATLPPAHGGYLGGWGMNPTNWNSYTGSFSAWGIYDPQQGTPSNGGDNWVIGYNPNMTPIYITYAPITLELWIEMYSLQTYHYTSYQWHRLGNQAEHICFDIQGTIQSNNGQWVSLVHGAQALTHLWFIEDMFGRTDPGTLPPGYVGDANLELTWTGTWGRGLAYGQDIQGGPTVIVPGPDVDMLIAEPCDHWFQFEGCFDIPYHQPDGYYNLTMAGCPAPQL